MTLETKTKLGQRRVVVQEIEFGYYTLEVGFLSVKNLIPCLPAVLVPVIGFAWPGFPPSSHVLN